ncbi:hypothetical protein [Spiroplasma endosymbiont of Villa modesta]|uniref:hypothetical protein n=1 Tax=Spiroplasma endosymbiont of Villa modesta TaxID=3066293 RepID=UPI00313A8CA6
MISNETGIKIVSITFALTIMISAIGWLGFRKKNVKSYIILWLGIIPLIISGIFSFFTKEYHDNILLILILLISYLIYIFFLIISTYKFIKIKKENPKIEEQINKTIELIDNNIPPKS